MKKRLALLAVAVALVVPHVLVAEESSSLSKTVATISEKLAEREYQKAFSYVEFLIKLYKNDAMPQEAVDISGQAVELYSQDLLARKKWQEIADLAGRLSGAPLAVQARAKEPIFRATAELTALEEARNARKRAALAAAKAAEDKKKAIAGTPPAAVEAAERTEVAPPQETALMDLRSEVEGWRADAERRDADLRASIVLLCAAVIVVLLAGFVSFCFVLFSSRTGLKKRGSTADGRDYAAYLSFPMLGASDDFEKTCDGFSDEEIRSLLRACASSGRVIDAHTQRRNNSERVGRLVYAISVRVGYSHKAASIFSAAGMIRDLGFLSIDAAVFGSPAVTEEERGRLRSHVKAAETALLLIDERIRTTLARGIALHHENLDGSGYGEKAKGKEIPYLSRVLRLTESYVSLVSKSTYHAMKNSQEAIEELRGQSSWYDASLIDVLADEV